MRASEDHAQVMKLWAKRHRNLGSARTQLVCRLHAVLCELVPGGVSGQLYASHAARVLEGLEPEGAVATARYELAIDLVEDLAAHRRANERHKKADRGCSRRIKDDPHGDLRGRCDRGRDCRRRCR
jgi:hypothetical protein